jgi:flavin reductase (DIM6/NTAB) family NADH-FMN oxidoreductase RutF
VIELIGLKCSPKDTVANIQMHPFFVVNMVDEKHAQAMSDSATDYPESISEIDDLKLETIASPLIDVPRLADVPAAFECKLHSVQTICNNRLILGEMLGLNQAKFLDRVAKNTVDDGEFTML